MYDKSYFINLYNKNYEILYRFLCENIKQLLSPNSKILEFGCGNGGFIKYFEQNYYKFNSIIQTDIVEQEHIDNNRFQKMSMDDPAISRDPINLFDAILAFDVIEHIPNQGNMFNNVNHLLKSGGLFIFSTPNSDSFKKYLYSFIGKNWCGYSDKSHLILYDSYILKRNLKNLLSSVKIIPFSQFGKFIFRHNIGADYFLGICRK